MIEDYAYSYDFSINQSMYLFKLDYIWILFQAQAKFIDEFTVESDAGRIWSNVVVVAKGKVRLPKERKDCQGKLSLSKEM